jgi:hypothetical protein
LDGSGSASIAMAGEAGEAGAVGAVPGESLCDYKAITDSARCAFFDKNSQLRMSLNPTPARLKRAGM